MARPEVLAWWRAGPTRLRRLGLCAGLSFVAAISIFAVIYGPVLATGAARGFGEYLVYAPTPIDILNVGPGNLVWSRLIRWSHLISENRLDNGEVSIALTPVLQLLLVSSAMLAFRQPSGVRRISRAMVIAGASVCLLFYLLTLKTHNHSLFHVLYAAVPGARAIRVGYRGMVVANFFAVTAIGLTFDRIIRSSLHQPGVLFRVGKLTALAAILGLAAIEQVNLGQATHKSRKFEHQFLAAVDEPPPECRDFYAAPQPRHAPFEVQIDAMMVAQARGLPTINGYSGLFPPGWDFYDTNAADYEQRARRWAENRGVARGLCRIDIERGIWTALP